MFSFEGTKMKLEVSAQRWIFQQPFRLHQELENRLGMVIRILFGKKMIKNYFQNSLLIVIPGVF